MNQRLEFAKRGTLDVEVDESMQIVATPDHIPCQVMRLLPDKMAPHKYVKHARYKGGKLRITPVPSSNTIQQHRIIAVILEYLKRYVASLISKRKSQGGTSKHRPKTPGRNVRHQGRRQITQSSTVRLR